MAWRVCLRERKKGIGYYNPTGCAKGANRYAITSSCNGQFETIVEVRSGFWRWISILRRHLHKTNCKQVTVDHRVSWVRSVERDATTAASLTFASVPAPRKKREGDTLSFLSTNFARFQPHVRWMVALIKAAKTISGINTSIRPPCAELHLFA